MTRLTRTLACLFAVFASFNSSLHADETSLSAPENNNTDGASRPLVPISSPAAVIHVEEVRRISPHHDYYSGWPSLASRKNGDLVVIYSGGRDYHVCPFGRLEMMTSKDGGQNWSPPHILVNSDLDDRGPSILETAEGTLLIGYISSSVYKRHLNNPERLLNRVFGDQIEAHLSRWHAQDKKTTPAQKREIAGEYGGRMLIRSSDGGQSWSDPMPVPFFSPREPALLSDNRILYVAGDGLVVGAFISSDDGMTWERVSELPTTAGEAHAVEAANGAIVAHVREKETVPSGGRMQYTTQTRSIDGGRTWSTPRKVADGYPSHLIRRSNGALVMTYGMRIAPFGIRGRISADHGESWSEEFILTDDGPTWDLGYPSTAELPDGRLVTVWYEVPEGERNAVIRQAIWTLE